MSMKEISTMSHLTELAAHCAVTCGKSDNMRATASKMVCDAVEYLKTDAGIMEAVEAGVEPNAKGFHHLVIHAERTEADGTKTPLFPLRSWSSSFRSFQRLLQIKGNPDIDAAVRQEQAMYDTGRRTAAASSPNDDIVTKTASAGANCNSAPSIEWIKTQLAGWWAAADDTQRAELRNWFFTTCPAPAQQVEVEEPEQAEVPEQVEAEELFGDELILQKLRCNTWIGPAKLEELEVSEEDVERFLAAGKLHTHPELPNCVGLVEAV